MSKALDLVRVEWFDAEGNGDWLSHDDFKATVEGELDVVTTFGLLTHETSNFVVVLQTLSDSQVRGSLKIPRGCIKAIERLGSANLTL